MHTRFLSLEMHRNVVYTNGIAKQTKQFICQGKSCQIVKNSDFQKICTAYDQCVFFCFLIKIWKKESKKDLTRDYLILYDIGISLSSRNSYWPCTPKSYKFFHTDFSTILMLLICSTMLVT